MAVLVFNQVYNDMLTELRRNEVISHAIKVRVFDKSSTQYIDAFDAVKDVVLEWVRDGATDQLSSQRALLECTILGVPMDLIYKSLVSNDVVILETYLVTLACLALLYGDEDVTDGQLETLIQKLADIENGDELHMDEILDADLCAMLRVIEKLKKQSIDSESTSGATPPYPDKAPDISSGAPDELINALNTTKIGRIAQEISKSIDPSSISLSPTGALDGKGLGSMIESISSVVNQKIATGELKCDELFGEAMSMMKYMQGSGGAGSLLKSMMSGPMGRKLGAQDRLSKRYRAKYGESKH